MGIPGAGKTRLADDYVARGYERLNRDERGGSLRDDRPGAGRAARRRRAPVVLDNTYLTRAARSHVIEAAARHGIAGPLRLARAPRWRTPRSTSSTRLLELAARCPRPRSSGCWPAAAAGMIAPTSQMRALRELEPPSLDEGFAAVERCPFARAASPERAGPAVLVAARR